MSESGPGKSSGSFADRPRNYPSARYSPVLATRPAPADLDRLKARKERFDQLNANVREMGAWLVSIAGDRLVTVETLPDSMVPDRLRDAGYALWEIDGGERIIPYAIEERMTKNADGTLAPLTPGSTQPVTVRMHHAGLSRTRRWQFMMMD